LGSKGGNKEKGKSKKGFVNYQRRKKKIKEKEKKKKKKNYAKTSGHRNWEEGRDRGWSIPKT